LLTENPKAIVIFAHGSASNRYSTRNNYVSEVLNEYRLATLLVDLLTAEEKQEDEKKKQIRFDVELLTERLIGITNWLAQDAGTSRLAIGYFGSSTGAAAALLAATRLNGLVKAIVSRGGRLDFADSKERLENVTAATLLIVGGNESEALTRANKRVLRKLASADAKELVIINGAGHLFEEAAKIEEVSNVATEWFKCYLVRNGTEFVNTYGETRIAGLVSRLRDITLGMKFKNRKAAGEILASILGKYGKEKNLTVIGIPRGGIIVADVIAKKLEAELNIVISRRLGAPGNKERTIGALLQDGSTYFMEHVIQSDRISSEYIDAEISRQKEEIGHSRKLYRPISREYMVKNRTVILVDDGAATGATLIIAARWIRKQQPERLIIAVPIMPHSTLKRLQVEADVVETIKSPSNFKTVEQFYQDFRSVEDIEVLQSLRRHNLL